MVYPLKLKGSLTFVLLILLSLPVYAQGKDKEVKIAVLSAWGDNVTRSMWTPTIRYLEKSIPGYHFVLQPLKLTQTANVVKEHSVDFILTNPGNYIELEARYGISRLATVKTRKLNYVGSQFAAIIFTRRDRNDINSLNDLRSKSFMGVKKTAFGGFQMAWLELKEKGIDPFKDFSSVQYSGLPQDNIVYAVMNGKVDAGTVRTSTLERMAAEHLIDLTKFKILNQKKDDSFPFIHSTPLYPEWPIAKLKNTSEDLSRKVTIALLNLPDSSEVAKRAKISGWTVPLDYHPVRNMFKKLNIGPYAVKDPGFFRQYKWQIILFIVLVLPATLFYVTKLKIRIRDDEKQFAQAETEWSNALDFLDEPMYMVDLEDRIIRANKAFYKKINATAEEAIGHVVTRFTHPEGEEVPCRVCQARKDLIDTTITLEADDKANKAGKPMEVSIKVIRNDNNDAIGIIQKMHDLTEAREAEKAFRRNELMFKELLNSTPEPLVVSNTDGTIVLVNSQFEKEFGYPREEIIGNKIEMLMPGEYRSGHVSLRAQYAQNPQVRPLVQDMILEGQHKDGHHIPLEISLSPFQIDDEMFTIATLHDISERMAREAELKRLASFPELNPIPVIEFTRDGAITYANPASLKAFPDLADANAAHDIFIDIESYFAELETDFELIRDIQIGNATYEQNIIYDPDTTLFRMYVWDITKLRNLSVKMSYQATHDALTNLINRREFERRLEQAAIDANTNNKTHTLCFMDLDKFKAVNDTCGHIAGDELLKQISALIHSKIRETDTFARIGGDEFGLLLSGCPVEKAFTLAEIILKSVEDFRFHWDDKTFKIGVCIGIVTLDNKSGTLKEILSAADTACYLAKEQGRNRIHIYETDQAALLKHHNEVNWLNRINDALDKNNFVLYFQKIAALNSDCSDHYEVLIRMIAEDGSTIPPSAFIPAAERFEVMTSIDHWVIQQILLIMQQPRYKNLNLSINLSGQSLGDKKFMQECIDQIKHSQVNTDKLCFEITETAMIANLTNAIRAVSILRDLGCKLSLDDFGSGLSSFAYLKNLPVDFLKIDGSLIRELEHDQSNITMVESIIHIGHSMGLKTIAEYVENQAILEIVQSMKIDFVQGYGIARPVPVDELDEILELNSTTPLVM